MTMDTPLRIALVAARPGTRAALARWLRSIAPAGSRVSVTVGAAGLPASGDALDLVALAIESAIHVPPDETLDAVREVLANRPGVPVVIASEQERAVPVAEWVRHGARGYIPATLDPPTARVALHVIRSGGMFVPTVALGEVRPAAGDEER